LDLSQPLSELAQTELKAALAQFEVIFFRDQVLTPAQQVAFTRSFGQVNEVKAFFPRVESQPEIEIVESTAERPAANNNWHSDITWQANPPIGTSLYAQVIPASGGDTVWASMTTAYEGLPADFKAYLETLSAMHTWEVTGWTEYLLRQVPARDAPRGARAPHHGQKDFVRQPYFHHPHPWPATPAKRRIAGAVVWADHGTGSASPISLAGPLIGRVGQPFDPALRRGRLLSAAPQTAPGYVHGRQHFLSRRR
jgi:alpha-ketoglutarate-dependent taurine dioxygenase